MKICFAFGLQNESDDDHDDDYLMVSLPNISHQISSDDNEELAPTINLTPEHVSEPESTHSDDGPSPSTSATMSLSRYEILA